VTAGAEPSTRLSISRRLLARVVAACFVR
jgi:hypothetical protein